jgi:hypothetical protein
MASVPAKLRERLDFVVNAVPADFGGGSGLEKALTSAALIERHGFTSYVEIGVYRGRSLLPVAAVFAAAGRGSAVGIDPWNVIAATQQDVHLFPVSVSMVNEFVESLDWDAIYGDVAQLVTELGLTEYCELRRARAAEVAATIPDGSVGVLHVDGNHDEASVMADLENYLPKMRPDGFVVLDDVSWESVGAARAVLERNHRFLFMDDVNDFALYSVS